MPFHNILLIDDDADDQEIFITAIQQISPDLNCTMLDDATTAIAQLSAGIVKPDIVFLDLNMPLKSGQSFLSDLQQLGLLRKFPVIVLSTSERPATIAETMELGATRFITKPETFDQLVVILRSILSS